MIPFYKDFTNLPLFVSSINSFVSIGTSNKKNKKMKKKNKE